MSTLLRKLFDEILVEVDRRPDFRRRLEGILVPPTGPSRRPEPPHQLRRRGRRAPPVLDPFAVFADGESVLRNRLASLSLDQLKDIVSGHALDSSRLALKWKNSARLIDLIVSMVRARLEKGDPFRR